eukprot:5015876-Prorocentrum_lima.AAC.1
MHGVVSPLLANVVSSTCPYCGQPKHTRLKCVQHIRRSKTCLLAFTCDSYVAPPELFAAALLQDQETRQIAKASGIGELA